MPDDSVIKNKNKNNAIKMGPVMQKVILLLTAGAALSLTRRPGAHFRIIKSASKEWKNINHRTLRESIKRLYQSKVIRCIENSDGLLMLELTDEGKKRVLRYHPSKMKIKKPIKWDGLWRLVIFDIPESMKRERMALAGMLRRLDFYPLQRSVFIFPYECKNEIDFVVEMFNLRPYVRFLIVKDIDNGLDLRNRFTLE